MNLIKGKYTYWTSNDYFSIWRINNKTKEVHVKKQNLGKWVKSINDLNDFKFDAGMTLKEAKEKRRVY